MNGDLEREDEKDGERSGGFADSFESWHGGGS
jgi:hypothetical protein